MHKQKFQIGDIVNIKDGKYVSKDALKNNPYKIIASKLHGKIAWTYTITSANTINDDKFHYYEFALETARDHLGRTLPISTHEQECSFAQTGWAYCTCDDINKKSRMKDACDDYFSMLEESQIKQPQTFKRGNEVKINLDFDGIIVEVQEASPIESAGKLVTPRQYKVKTDSGHIFYVTSDKMTLKNND